MPDSSTPSDRAPKYGGLTAAQLFEADRLATRNWSLDTAHDMVFVNNPDEAVARFDLAFAQRALEDATVAIMARNALTDLLGALEVAERENERLRRAIKEALDEYDYERHYDAIGEVMARPLRAALGDQ